jgi:hypothetical protein
MLTCATALLHCMPRASHLTRALLHYFDRKFSEHVSGGRSAMHVERTSWMIVMMARARV